MMAFDFPVCPVCRGNGRGAVKGDLEAVEGPVCSTCQGHRELTAIASGGVAEGR